MIKDEVQCGAWIPIKLNRYTPPISHIMFTDDLMLFGECSVRQVDTMKNVVDKFCNASGAKVSCAKSKILC